MFKSKIFPIIKNHWEKIIIIFLVLIVYNQWVFHLGNLMSGDWIFHNQISLLVFYRVPQLWNSFWDYGSFGSVNILPTFDFIQVCYGLLAHFFNYAILERLFYFWTILIFSYIGILKLGKLIFKDNKIGILFFAIFFLFNTYILSIQTSFITYANVYALSPIVFYLFIKLLNGKISFKNMLSAALILFLCSLYEPRGLVALSYFLFFYFIYVFFFVGISKTSVLLNFVATYTILGALNFYWILPNLFLSTFGKYLSGIGVFSAFASILDALSFHSYAWQGNIFNSFTLIPFHDVVPSFYFFIVAILTFFPIFFYKKLREHSFIIFLLASSLIGVFLIKQQNPPFGFVYEWMYSHLPTFDLFRESAAFVMFFLPISLLFGFSISFLTSKIKNFFARAFFLSIVALLVLINVAPIVDQQIRTLFVNRNMPEDYVVLNNFIIGQSDYSRNIFIPQDSSWIVYSDLHPKVSTVDMIQGAWGNLVDYGGDGNSWPMQGQIVDVLKENFSNQLLNVSSIKYVIVPIEDTASDDDFFIDYGGAQNPNIRQWYIDQLNQISWLKKIDIGTTDLVVYENENYRPHIYTTASLETIYRDVPYANVSSTQINPTEYTVHLTNVTSSVFVNFSESFDPNWKVHVGPFAWYDAFGANYFLPDSFHFQNDATLNSFIIDPNYIRQNLPASAYKVNPDGSIDVDLTIYFKQQSYFYVGLIISGATLLACLGYVGWDFARRRKKKLAATATIKKEEDV